MDKYENMADTISDINDELSDHELDDRTEELIDIADEIDD